MHKPAGRCFRLLNCIALIILSGSFLDTSLAKSYHLPSIEVTARIHNEGTLEVEERIQYRFRGSYTYAYRTIPLLPGEEIQSLSVSEDGLEYQLGNSKQPSTFTTSGEDSGLEVRWYFRARNQTRTFVMRYTLIGVVHRYSDIAELHYVFLGKGWSKPIGRLQARVEFPAGTDLEQVEAWVRNPMRGRVERVGDGIQFSAVDWPRRSAFSGRVLFPVSAVSGLSIEGSAPMAASIRQAEEQALESLRRTEELRRQWEATLFPWMFVLPLVTWLIWYLLFLQHGRRHQVTTTVPTGHIPEQDPLFARWVFSRSVGGVTLVATLFDLARRGYLQIREELVPGRPGRKPRHDYHFQVKRMPLRNLRRFELELLENLPQLIGDAGGFRISDLKRRARKSPSRFQKWFHAWSRLFLQKAKGEEIFEPTPTGAIAINLLLGLAVILAGAGASIALSSRVGLPSLILGGGQMIASLALRRRTWKGERLLQEWKSFREQLKKGHVISSGPATSVDSILVASVLLGVVKDFNRLLESNGLASHPEWFVAAGHGDGGGIGSVSGGFQSMVSSVSSWTSAVSAAAGAGAAASGGGGGGAG